MLRCQIYVGTIHKLWRVAEPDKIRNIIFKKEFKLKNSVAVDLFSNTIYPYFSGIMLSDWNFKYYEKLQLDEEYIVTYGYSLNSYLKNKGYPFILSDIDIDTIINEELEFIKKDFIITNYILNRENMDNRKNEKEKYLSFK